MKTTTPAPKFRALEIAYRMPGKEWKRATVKTQSALDKLLKRIEDGAAESVSRPLEDVAPLCHEES